MEGICMAGSVLAKMGVWPGRFTEVDLWLSWPANKDESEKIELQRRKIYKGLSCGTEQLPRGPLYSAMLPMRKIHPDETDQSKLTPFIEHNKIMLDCKT